MGEVVNLKRARKAKGRAAAEAVAAENRVRHGRTKAEKQRDKVEAEKAVTHLDGHKRDKSE